MFQRLEVPREIQAGEGTRGQHISINDCAAEFAIKGIAATSLPVAQTGYTKDIDPTQTPLDPLNTAIQAVHM